MKIETNTEDYIPQTWSKISYPPVWTNLFFLVPSYLAEVNGVFTTSLLIKTALVASIIYHLYSENRRFHLFDRVMAFVIMSNNFYLISRESNLAYLGITFALVVFALYSYHRARINKDVYVLSHSLWHVSSAAITAICVLAYIKS